MVTNQSSFTEDMTQLGQAIGDGAHAAGVALGLVDGDVIPGDPAEMDAVAEHLTSLGGAFERAGNGFRAIDDGGWTGAAADGFRAYLDTCPPKWFAAASAFSSAGEKVAHYAQVLREAKTAAEQAKQQLEQADTATTTALARHAAAVDTYNQQVSIANQGGPRPGRGPGQFVDPGAQERADAKAAIADAKARVRAAGDQAADALAAARKDAPAEPGLMAQWSANLADAWEQGGRMLGNVGAGLAEGVGGVVQMARAVVPLDTYKLTHPMQWADTAGSFATNLASAAVNDPWGTVKSAVDIDGWRNNPGRSFGSAVPDLVASLAGGAGVASRVGSGLRRVGEIGTKLDNAMPAPKSAPGVEPPRWHGPAPGPNTHGPGQPVPATPSPEGQANELVQQVREHGDGIGMNDRYDFTPGSEDLPEGLSRDNPDPHGLDAAGRGGADDPNLIYRDVDPADDNNALWRASRLDDARIDEIFERGIVPRGDESGRADFESLDGHVSGNTHTRWVSTTDSLEHALHRGQADVERYGAVLKIRSGGGVDFDATMHDLVGDSPLGYVSHGEREISLLDGVDPRNIEGALRPVDFAANGAPLRYEWKPNPHFDPAVLTRGNHR